jgi:L-alanine-DL-glutamate epimerase-like enolase superfamily enzyme
MKFDHKRVTLHPKVPFAISRSSTVAYERVYIHLTDNQGTTGLGEAAPNVYYKENADTVLAAFARFERVVDRIPTVESLHDIDVLEEWLRTESPSDASARAAISAAAHDLLGWKERKPVWQLYGLDPAFMPVSSFTIAIANDEHDLLQRIAEAHRYPILKIKLGTERDEWIARTVRRAAPTKTLRADANAAWTLDRARTMVKLLADLGFELIEQPLPPDDLQGMRALRAESPVPVIADESCLTASDLPRLEGAVHGINIKLSKCGGLAEAARMAREARRREMLVMVGCMVESSLGISAMAQLAPLANYADLDGAALLEDDPFTGATIDNGVIRLSAEPGLGVKPK